MFDIFPFLLHPVKWSGQFSLFWYWCHLLLSIKLRRTKKNSVKKMTSSNDTIVASSGEVEIEVFNVAAHEEVKKILTMKFFWKWQNPKRRQLFRLLVKWSLASFYLTADLREPSMEGRKTPKWKILLLRRQFRAWRTLKLTKDD